MSNIISEPWLTRSLNSVCKLSGGYGFPERLQGSMNGDLPFIKVSDMSMLGNEKKITRANNYVTNRLSERMAWKPFPAGSIVFAKVGAALMLNRRRILTKPTLIDNNMMAAVPCDFYDSGFLFHFLCTIYFGDFVQDGALPSVNQQQIGSIRVPELNLSEQRRIAEILDTIDEAIYKTEALIEKLKAMKKGLLHDLLTRGLDENGKLREPQAHPEQFKDSPLGRIHKGWHIIRLAQVCTHITKGATPTTYGHNWAETGILFLRSECVGEGKFTLEGADFITEEAHKEMLRSVIHGGDILMTITGNIGRVCRYPRNMPEANINQHIARIRLIDEDELNPDFVLWALQGPRQKNLLELEITGLAYPQIGLAQVQAIPLPKPNLNEQKQIAHILRE